MSDPFASASAYRARGWVGTLPLPLGRKTPPPAGFTGDGGAWPSPSDLVDWAESAPQNIALRLPPNVIALDVDDTAAFLALVELVGPLPATWRVHSGGDRLGHLYYRLPAGIVSTGWGAPCPGVDLLRHGHRYSIVAPSLHPSGTTYTWARPDVREGSDQRDALPGPGDLPELPAAWVSYLAGDEAVARDGSKQERAVDGDLLQVGTPIHAAPKGPGHQQVLFSHAASMRARGVREGEAEATIRYRAEHDCVPPWGTNPKPGDVGPWEAVKHAYKYEEGEQPETGPALTLVGAPTQTVDTSSDLSPEPPLIAPVDWHQAFDAPSEVAWIVPGLIPEGEGVSLYSPAGVGKSVLLLELAVAVATGRPFLGSPVEQRVVLYVDHENSLAGDVVRRLRDMEVGPGDLDNLRYLSYPEMIALNRTAGGAQLVEVAQQEGATLVVIDTISRAVDGEENSNDTINAFYRAAGLPLKRLGIAYIRLDHTGKDAERGARGGSAKSGDVGLIWRLDRPDPEREEFLLQCEKDRTPVAEKVIAFRRLDTPLRHERMPVPSYLDVEAATQRRIWAQMDALGVDVDPNKDNGQPLAKNALGTKLRDAGIKGEEKWTTSVARVRWAHLHNYPPAARPVWAPELPLSMTGGAQ